MRETILRADSFVSHHMAPVMVSCVLVGIFFSETFAPLNSIAIGLFAFMTFANSLGGGFRELLDVFRHPLPVITVVIVLHVVMPLITFGLGKLLFPEAPLFIIGLVLEYAIPTGVVTLLWTGLVRGNTSLCLSLVLLDTVCAPVVVPLTMQLFFGSDIQMNSASMMRDLALMIAIPALLAMTLYHFTNGRVATTLKPMLSPFSKVALMLVVMANATGCTPFLKDLDGTLLRVIAAVILLCMLGYFLGYWSGRLTHQDYPTVETMCMNCGMRNISAGAVLALAYFPPDVLFPVAFSPVFLQVVMALAAKCLHRTRPGRAFFGQEA